MAEESVRDQAARLAAEAIGPIPAASHHVPDWPEDEADLHRNGDWKSFTERAEGVDRFRAERAARRVVEALVAAGLLRDDAPDWEYGAAILPDPSVAPGSGWRGSRETAEQGVASMRQRYSKADPCVKRRRPAVPATPWEVAPDAD